MIEVLPPLGTYKYVTWRILPVKCNINNSLRLRSCVRNVNTAFLYNNSYQESLQMAPFKVLYWRRCRTLLNWIETGEKVIFGSDIVEEAEATIHHIQENLKAVKSQQETYANKRRRPLEFKVGDHVYLRVSPMKGMKRFGVKGKLAPRYIRPFVILEKCGTVAYKLDLPPSLARVHDIFHMSQLKKCLKAPMDVMLPVVTRLEADLSYPSPLTGVIWSHHSVCDTPSVTVAATMFKKYLMMSL
jgi:hypothetical protein